MSRPRRITAKYCYECSVNAVHRFEHRRADEQRAKWRAAKERKRQRDARPIDPTVIGTLHELGCRGNHRGVRLLGTRRCVPIIVRQKLRSVA